MLTSYLITSTSNLYFSKINSLQACNKDRRPLGIVYDPLWLIALAHIHNIPIYLHMDWAKLFWSIVTYFHTFLNTPHTRSITHVDNIILNSVISCKKPNIFATLVLLNNFRKISTLSSNTGMHYCVLIYLHPTFSINSVQSNSLTLINCWYTL